MRKFWVLNNTGICREIRRLSNLFVKIKASSLEPGLFIFCTLQIGCICYANDHFQPKKSKFSFTLTGTDLSSYFSSLHSKETVCIKDLKYPFLKLYILYIIIQYIFLLFSTIFSIYLKLQKASCIFICKMWLIDLLFPKFCKSDMSRYGYLEVFQRVSWTSR